MDQKIKRPSGRRFCFFTAVGLTNASALYILSDALPRSGPAALSTLIFIVYAVLFFWISFYFWTAMAGAFVLLAGRDKGAISRSIKEGGLRHQVRTAVIMPIRNENSARVFAGLETVLESILERGEHRLFDLFVLSDSDDRRTRSEEKIRTAMLRLRAAGKLRVYYRNRLHNARRKVGNIRDFCARWGHYYRYMIVLDADSIVSGDAVLKLVRMMERNPRAALIQLPSYPVNQNSLFARVHQFAARLYGPMLMAGLNVWQAGEANYWGHNAIIRIRPYMEHCELPSLSGPEPFGGEIWSHDFVEAALLRSAGWEVWLAYDVEGSYEEIPPNLAAYARRDLRWCRGNLQHARLLGWPGLHPISRFHLLSGIMAYLCAPLLLILILATGAELYLHRPGFLLNSGCSLFSGEPAMVFLVCLTALMFLLPRLVSLALFMLRPERLEAFGGLLRAGASVLLETAASVMISPILMVLKTRFVLSVLLGKRTVWERRSEDERTGFGEACAIHGGQTLLGMAAAAAFFLDAGAFFWWFAPALFWLVLSIPVSIFFSDVKAGIKAREAGLFVIPEESDPPPVIRAFQEIFSRNLSDQSRSRRRYRPRHPLPLEISARSDIRIPAAADYPSRPERSFCSASSEIRRVSAVYSFSPVASQMPE